VTVDHYAGAGRRWALGATLVYRPIATELVDMSPHSLAGRTVLDAGAGTGVGSEVLGARGAHPVAVDLSADMLAALPAAHAPRVVGDIRHLPVAEGSIDDALAAFVLNHLQQPGIGLAELVRVVRPGGAVLAAVYSNESRSAARDRIDQVATGAGWRAPDWYVDLKATAVPLLGNAASMEAAARSAGLVSITVDERPVDVGITQPEQLVDYRFGQAQFAGWLDGIGAAHSEEVRGLAIEEIRPIMTPYRPIVVFLVALRTVAS
jgi:ubiquinone/menaquinone biosynthesis C-methylase UbiE